MLPQRPLISPSSSLLVITGLRGVNLPTRYSSTCFTAENGAFVSVKVVKGGARPGNPHEVDAISGGTITSKGLEAMVHDGLIKYEKYLSLNRK